MKKRIKEKISKLGGKFVELLSYVGIGLCLLFAFIISTSIIGLPTMLIIFAIKGII